MRGRTGVALVCLASAGCGGEDKAPAPGTSGVTITYLRHDNSAYVRADRAYFAEYMAAHPGVTIVDTTVDFRTLASTLNGDLTQNQFMYDLVLVPPSRLCGYAANITDVPDEVITLPDAQQTFFAAPLAGSTCDGKLKGLPV